MSGLSQDHVSWWCLKCHCSLEWVTLCDLVFVRAAQLTCSAGHRVWHNLFVESLHALNTKKPKEHKFCIIYLLPSPRPIVSFGGFPMPGADRSLEPLITFFSSAQPVIIIFLCLLPLLLCSNKVLVLQWYLRMSDLQDRCPKGCTATKAGDVSSWILMGCSQFNKKSAFSCWSDENFQAWGSWWQRKAGVLLPREVLVDWVKSEETDPAYRISLDHSCCRVHMAKGRVWWLWKIFLYCHTSLHELWSVGPLEIKPPLLAGFISLYLDHLISKPFPSPPRALGSPARAGAPLAQAPLQLHPWFAPRWFHTLWELSSFLGCFWLPWAFWGMGEAPAEVVPAQTHPRNRSPSFSGSWTTSGCQF